MRVFITGASGFIGSNFIGSLSKSHEIGVLVRPSSKLKDEVANEIVGQYIYHGNLESVLEAFEAFKPEIVIHLASYYVYDHKPEEVDVLLESNIKIGTYLLEAMKLKEVKYLINTGTSFEHFGNNEDAAVNLYAATKQAFTDLCKYYCDAGFIRAVSLKLFDTYGDGDERKKLLNLLKDILVSKQELLLSPGDQIIDIVHVEDLMLAYEAAINQISSFDKSYLEFGLSGQHRCSLKELVELIEKITGESLNIKWGARPYRDREVMKPWNSFMELPGWKPKITLEEGLTRFFNS